MGGDDLGSDDEYLIIFRRSLSFVVVRTKKTVDHVGSEELQDGSVETLQHRKEAECFKQGVKQDYV